MTRILVAYASRRGSTAEIAQWIGAALRAGDGGSDGDVRVDVRDAGQAGDPASYDAVVLGSALYAGRWCRPARRFARRNQHTLMHMPVWLFSSGPLDHTADDGTLPPPRAVARLAERFDASGVVTFGGALHPGTRGRLARAMAEQRGGDFRDRDQVRRWALEIGAALAAARGTAG